MRLLILGGTAFLGRAVAAYAVGKGHQVTCAARGVSGPVPDGVRFVPVDRSAPGGLDPVTGDFDAVIDVAQVPSQVPSRPQGLCMDGHGHSLAAL